MTTRRTRQTAGLVLLPLVAVLGVSAPAAHGETTPAPAPTSSLSPTPSPSDTAVDQLCEQASAEAPVRVLVTTLTPRAPRPVDETLRVAGRLVNCGRDPVDGVEVRLGVGSRLTTRSGLAQADEEPVVGTRRLTVEPTDEPLAARASTPFDLQLPIEDLRLGRRNGVFPLTVQARARVGSEDTRSQVGLASTFVPWLPDVPIAPTRIAWVIPLVDQPRRGPDEVLLDDALTELLEADDPDGADGGRLQRVLRSGTSGAAGACDLSAGPLEPETDSAPAPDAVPDAVPVVPPCRGEPVPVTYAVDPDLLGSVETMTQPYPVRSAGEVETLPASADAQAWLDALRAAAAEGADVLALPYGDPDVVALTRPGSQLRDDVEALRRIGQSEAARVLGREPLSSLAWLPPGPLGSSVDTLAGGQVDTLLVDPSSLPAAAPLAGRTPNARTTLPSTVEPVNALVPDEALSRLLEPDPTSRSWQGERLAEQRWVAEAAALTAERPSESRTIVVAPRRRADLLPGVAGAVIADSGRLPWLCPVSLAAAAAGTESCAVLTDEQGPAPSEPRGTPVPRTQDDTELSADFVADLGDVRQAADQFTEQVLVAGSDAATDTKARLLRARGRTASTAWWTQRGGQMLLRLLRTEVEALRQQIRLVISQPVLLTGSSGTIRLVVQNELDQPVNVGVGLPRNPAARLESSDTGLQVVPARQAVQVAIRVDVRTSGRFTVRASLVDAAGQPFGEQVELPVRSTQYGRVALGITGVAAAVLLIAVGVRITRRALRKRPAEEPATPVEPATPGSGV